MRRDNRLAAELLPRALEAGRLLVERLAVTDTAAHKLRPLGHGGYGVGLLGEQPPQPGLVPAEVVPAAVAVLADGGPQPLGFLNQGFPAHGLEVGVHTAQNTR